MPRKAFKRTDAAAPAPIAKKHVFGLVAQSSRKKELDDLGPIERITRKDIILLRDLCAHEGSGEIARKIGVHEVTLLRAMAGLGERCIARSTEALRKFLGDVNS